MLYSWVRILFLQFPFMTSYCSGGWYMQLCSNISLCKLLLETHVLYPLCMGNWVLITILSRLCSIFTFYNITSSEAWAMNERETWILEPSLAVTWSNTIDFIPILLLQYGYLRSWHMSKHCRSMKYMTSCGACFHLLQWHLRINAYEIIFALCGDCNAVLS